MVLTSCSAREKSEGVEGPKEEEMAVVSGDDEMAG